MVYISWVVLVLVDDQDVRQRAGLWVALGPWVEVEEVVADRLVPRILARQSHPRVLARSTPHQG